MSPHASLARRLARVLAAHAAGRLAALHSSWGRAMVGEVEHLASDRAALAWAIGSVRAAYVTRLAAMHIGNLQPSHPVLALEMLACFTWLTGVFVSAALQASASHPSFTGHLGALMLGSLLGPVALAISVDLLSGHATAPRRGTLIALAVLATATLAVLGSGLLLPLGWRDYVLCVVLPIVGVARLARLGVPPVGRPCTARA